MEKEMSSVTRFVYKFATQGLMWPALFGWVFGVCVFNFNNNIICALLGSFVFFPGYLLVMPFIGIFTPITFSILLAIGMFAGLHSDDPFYGYIATILLGIHIFRTITWIVLVKKYPIQTQHIDIEY